MSDAEIDFRSASRRALFGEETQESIPGEGTSAAEAPERHLRVKITMNIDSDLLSFFKEQAKQSGRSYQLLINDALREHVEGSKPEKMAKKAAEILLEDDSFIAKVLEKIQPSSEKKPNLDTEVENKEQEKPVHAWQCLRR